MLAATLTMMLLAMAAMTGAPAGNSAVASQTEDRAGRDAPVVLDRDDLAGFSAAGVAEVRLLTGDTVRVSFGSDGAPEVRDIEEAPRDGRVNVVFTTFTRGDDLYVVPDDALSLVAQDLLDEELFNVRKLAELAEEGDVEAGDIPVIVTYRTPSDARGARSADGMTVGSALRSIDGVSATVDADGGWWKALPAQAKGRKRPGPAEGTRSGSVDRAAARVSTSSPLDGIEKMWLNERATITLHESVPQIGTPVAWAAGLEGTGVTVAVLDTGVDLDHPDLAGKIVAERDFTGNPDGPRDGHGHGTHVAATIAGTGDAAGRLRPGVAPGASLISGKVCSDGGSCPTDAVIGGMEWAAQSGAKVVNMSLGGSATDGTDPMSQAVNALTLEHGTLFVIAAGNSGPRAGTVGTPAAADEALAVAAVDKVDEMAPFSGRGPRVGDGAPKPDIAAPGVAIVAARATGTAMGTPVDAFYTTASGTSMATPHVAGAAAIAAQQHPDLGGRQLKALLMNTAADLGHDLHAQGAGRVDLARAVDGAVIDDGHVSFGRHAYPHAPLSRTVTYTNLADEALTLTLSPTLSAADGTPAPAGMLTVEPAQVTVPAGDSVPVSVTLDGSLLDGGSVFGPFTGAVAATDGAGALRLSTRVTAFLEPERFSVEAEVVNLPDDALDVTYQAWTVLPVDDQTQLHDGPVTAPAGPAASTSVFGGTFAVRTSLTWRDAAGAEHLALVVVPEVAVTTDTVVRVDLGQARRLAVRGPEQGLQTYRAAARYERVSSTGIWSLTSSVRASYPTGEPNWWVVPTGEVSVGTFEFSSSHALGPALTTMRRVGSGRAQLDPRHGSADVSVPGGSLRVPGVTDAGAPTQTYWQVRLGVPRLDVSGPVPVVHAGQGKADDYDGLDARGALVLLTPDDVCEDECDFVALQERAGTAADAGAIGVLVAGDQGRVGLGAPPAAETTVCEPGAGIDGCPPVVPYAAVPVLSLPASEAAPLIDDLAQDRRVRLTVGGSDRLDRLYLLGYSEDRIPADLPHRAAGVDFHRVDHRLHADEPGETLRFVWRRHRADEAAVPELTIPNVALPGSLSLHVGPLDAEAIDEFEVTSFEGFEGPFARLDQEAVFTEDGRQHLLRMHTTTERHQHVLDEVTRRAEVSWNVRPFVPGIDARATTASGFATQAPLCAGCRQGDVLYPMFWITSAAGHTTDTVGVVNDLGITGLLGWRPACQPAPGPDPAVVVDPLHGPIEGPHSQRAAQPTCDLRLYDEARDEIPQRRIPFVVM